MLIATIYSQEVQRDRGEGTVPETGRFEFEVHLDERLIEEDADPRGMILRYIANEAAGLVTQHQLPLFLWNAKISPRVRHLTNLPRTVEFK